MLAIHKLTKIYPGPVQALTDVDLEVGRGMFGLLGPNGAGKTTLMRIISGLLEPTSGSVTLYGQDVVADPRRVWERLGYLPQEFGFYPHLTGEKMLAHLLRLKGVEAEGRKLGELCAELLERVNLTASAGQKVSAYSGGMRQRLGVAQAIAGDPRLIIVDEPTAGLDPEERLRIYRLLAELAEDRIVLLSTHIVEDVAVLCTRFAIIRQGRLVTCTTPAEARRRNIRFLAYNLRFLIGYPETTSSGRGPKEVRPIRRISSALPSCSSRASRYGCQDVKGSPHEPECQFVSSPQ